MAGDIKRDTVFTALTRPQMFAGVTYSFFVVNAVLFVELFLIFGNFKVLAVAVAIHFIGVVACLREPRILDLWLTRVRHCPRIPNFRFWRCNSYRP